MDAEVVKSLADSCRTDPEYHVPQRVENGAQTCLPHETETARFSRRIVNGQYLAKDVGVVPRQCFLKAL
jgi:hypothetical protein